MTTTFDIGRSTGGKPINLAQLQDELGMNAALGLVGDLVFTYDADGNPIDFPAAQAATVDAAIAAHIALRDKTDEEYALEFQNPATTAARRQQIRDITAGLLPREQVRVDNGQPLNTPPPPADPLAEVKNLSLGQGRADDFRDALVAYLESR